MQCNQKDKQKDVIVQITVNRIKLFFLFLSIMLNFY
jgi:hypothetical protein